MVGLVVCLVVLSAGVRRAWAVEGGRPVIVSMDWGFGGQITVGANINPEGLETVYEIAVECPEVCGLEPAAQRTVGELPADKEKHEVTLDVTGITPGIHFYWVRASNAAGEAYWRTQIEVPAPPPGACPQGCSSGKPYETELSQATIEQSAQFGAEAPARQAAREAQAARELAERHAGEQAAAQARLAEERAAREHQEEQEQAARRGSVQVCTVPQLHGDTLPAARRALARAHCRLGHIHMPARAGRRLRITGQSPRPGRTLPAGSRVAVTLSAAHR